MTNAQKEMHNFIFEFEKENKRLPDLEEISLILGKKIQHVARVCKALGLHDGVEGLPTNQKKVLEVYKEGMPQRLIADLTGVNINCISGIIGALKKKGFIEESKYDYINSKKKKKIENSVKYIEVLCGSHKGWRGYVLKEYSSANICVVFDKKGNEEELKIDHLDYKIIERNNNTRRKKDKESD
jgi:transposase